jgi:lactate dehydrogenase-like 2-hydroxyacid dehydrogenase
MTQQQQPSSKHPADRTETARIYYTTVLVEAIYGADTLTHSIPLTRMTSQLMEMEKTETLEQIEHLIVYLEGLRAQVEAVDTEKKESQG